jgi:hypothetical protein
VGVTLGAPSLGMERQALQCPQHAAFALIFGQAPIDLGDGWEQSIRVRHKDELRWGLVSTPVILSRPDLTSSYI